MSTEESNSLWTEICTKGLDAEAKVEIEASLAFRKSTPREVYLSNITTGIDDVFKNGTDALDDYKDTFGVDLQELPAHKTKIRSLVDSGVRTDNQGEHPYASLGKKRNTTSNLFFEVVCILLASICGYLKDVQKTSNRPPRSVSATRAQRPQRRLCH